LTLRIPRSIALWIVASLVTAGIAVSFLESYRALYWWASRHQVTGRWAAIWPIQIDAFVAVGELALFVALVDLWKVRHRSLPWLITAGGLAVSIAGNVGHVVTHDVFTRLTAAVPPVTAYVMLAAGLGLLKRVVANQPAPVAESEPAVFRLPLPPEELVARHPNWNVNHMRALTQLTENPKLTGRDFAPMINTSERHARRILKEVREAA
jgi:Protein of unknown function (DUF2637)